MKTTTLIDERVSGLSQGDLSSGEVSPGVLAPLSSLWTLLRRLFASVHIQRRERKLRLCDSLALGDKRIIAVIEFEHQRFLVAATPNNISLLQALPAPAGDGTRASEGA